MATAEINVSNLVQVIRTQLEKEVKRIIDEEVGTIQARIDERIRAAAVDLSIRISTQFQHDFSTDGRHIKITLEDKTT